MKNVLIERMKGEISELKTTNQVLQNSINELKVEIDKAKKSESENKTLKKVKKEDKLNTNGLNNKANNIKKKPSDSKRMFKELLQVLKANSEAIPKTITETLDKIFNNSKAINHSILLNENQGQTDKSLLDTEMFINEVLKSRDHPLIYKERHLNSSVDDAKKDKELRKSNSDNKVTNNLKENSSIRKSYYELSPVTRENKYFLCLSPINKHSSLTNNILLTSNNGLLNLIDKSDNYILGNDACLNFDQQISDKCNTIYEFDTVKPSTFTMGKNLNKHANDDVFVKDNQAHDSVFKRALESSNLSISKLDLSKSNSKLDMDNNILRRKFSIGNAKKLDAKTQYVMINDDNDIPDNKEFLDNDLKYNHLMDKRLLNQGEVDLIKVKTQPVSIIRKTVNLIDNHEEDLVVINEDLSRVTTQLNFKNKRDHRISDKNKDSLQNRDEKSIINQSIKQNPLLLIKEISSIKNNEDPLNTFESTSTNKNIDNDNYPNKFINKGVDVNITNNLTTNLNIQKNKQYYEFNIKEDVSDSKLRTRDFFPQELKINIDQNFINSTDPYLQEKKAPNLNPKKTSQINIDPNINENREIQNQKAIFNGEKPNHQGGSLSKLKTFDYYNNTEIEHSLQDKYNDQIANTLRDNDIYSLKNGPNSNQYNEVETTRTNIKMSLLNNNKISSPISSIRQNKNNVNYREIISSNKVNCLLN